MSKYEIVKYEDTEITVDLSLLQKNGPMYFNATEMAKGFDKKPYEYLRLPTTAAYTKALEESNLITGFPRNLKSTQKQELIITKTGKYGGSWFHKDLAIDFARWLSPKFAVALDKWVVSKFQEEFERKIYRLATREKAVLLTNAVEENTDDPKFYHYSNEFDMINVIITGMKAKKYKAAYGVKNVRDNLTVNQIHWMDRLQDRNTTLIDIGWSYQERKENLIELYNRNLIN